MTDTFRDLIRQLPVLTGTPPAFDFAHTPGDSATLFEEWLRVAVEDGVREPHAMTVSTTGGDGRPHARVLIVKDVDAAGWHFAISRVSQKGHDLATTPAAALTFYWPEQLRQVRVSGSVSEDPPEVSAADYRARSETSRARALTRRQSQPLGDEAELDAALDKAHLELAEEPGLVPEEWVSYCVRPDEVEFWQGSPDRRHVRLRYERDDVGGWAQQRLWP